LVLTLPTNSSRESTMAPVIFAFFQHGLSWRFVSNLLSVVKSFRALWPLYMSSFVLFEAAVLQTDFGEFKRFFPFFFATCLSFTPLFFFFFIHWEDRLPAFSLDWSFFALPSHDLLSPPQNFSPECTPIVTFFRTLVLYESSSSPLVSIKTSLYRDQGWI